MNSYSQLDTGTHSKDILVGNYISYGTESISNPTAVLPVNPISIADIHRVSIDSSSYEWVNWTGICNKMVTYEYLWSMGYQHSWDMDIYGSYIYQCQPIVVLV